jgi:hypothetical protein
MEDGGYLSQREEDWCRRLTAACWNNCQKTNYEYCGYSYDYCFIASSGSTQCTPTGCYSKATWLENQTASACSNYDQVGTNLHCGY